MLKQARTTHFTILVLCGTLMVLVLGSQSKSRLETAWQEATDLAKIDFTSTIMKLDIEQKVPALDLTGLAIGAVWALSSDEPSARASLKGLEKKRVEKVSHGESTKALIDVPSGPLRQPKRTILGSIDSIAVKHTTCIDSKPKAPENLMEIAKFFLGPYPDALVIDPFDLGDQLEACLRQKVSEKKIPSIDDALLMDYFVESDGNCAAKKAIGTILQFESQSDPSSTFACHVTSRTKRIRRSDKVLDSSFGKQLLKSSLVNRDDDNTVVFPTLFTMGKDYLKMEVAPLLADLDFRIREERRARGELKVIPFLGVQYSDAMKFFPLILSFLLLYLGAIIRNADRWVDPGKPPEWFLIVPGKMAGILSIGSLAVFPVLSCILLYTTSGSDDIALFSFMMIPVLLTTGFVVIEAIVVRKRCTEKQEQNSNVLH